MNSEARFEKVTIDAGDGEERVIRVSPDAGWVEVELVGGKSVRIQADGALSLDGRVILEADGDIQATRAAGRRGVTIHGGRGVQIGDGGIQANVF